MANWVLYQNGKISREPTLPKHQRHKQQTYKVIERQPNTDAGLAALQILRRNLNLENK